MGFKVDAGGFYGEYGGAYIPEMLYPNIRELENILEHAYVICKSQKIQVKHLPPEFIEKIKNIYPEFKTFSALENHESRIIQEALKNYAGNRTHTAKALGISRPTLWRKMKKFHIHFPVHRKKAN